MREIQDLCKHALRGAHEDRRLTLRPDLAQPAPVAAAIVGPSQVKRRRPRRGGKIGVSIGDRLAFGSADISSPCTSSLAPPYHSPTQSHEVFTPDTEPYVPLSASAAAEVAHGDFSSAEPLVTVAIPIESKVEPDTSFAEPIDKVITATQHVPQHDSSSVLNTTTQPNISELDNMIGAIATSPSSADPSASERSSEMFVPLSSSVEDDLILSSLENAQRPKLKKRKAKS